MKQDEIKYIVTTIDENYVQHCIVMLTSLFSNNKEDKFHVFILSNSLSPNSIKAIARFFKLKRNSFSRFQIDELLLKDAPVYGHVSLATYYRLLIPTILPQNIDRVLFIDCDIIINGSISLFWEKDILNYSHISVENGGDNSPFIKKIEMKIESKYFNAGVMLINIKWWRENNVFNKSIDFLKFNSEKITFWDQDVLNAILENKWLEFPLKYNAQSYLFGKSIDMDNLSYEELDAINNPLIVHFTGGGDSKPWHYNNQHPYKKVYQYFLYKTSFKHVLPIGTPVLIKLSLRDKFYLFRNKNKN